MINKVGSCLTNVHSYASRVSDEINYGILDNTRPVSEEEAKILSNFRCVGTLTALYENSSEWELSDLTEQVAAWEYDKEVEELEDNEYKNVYVSLSQTNLNTLDEFGALNFNEDENLVEPSTSLKDLKYYLEENPSPEDTAFRQHQYADDIEPPKKTKLFHLLSNKRRRKTLQYLEAEDKPYLDIKEFSEELASSRNRKHIDKLSSSERENFQIALKQHHLPELHKANIIEYNDRSGLIHPDVYLEPTLEYLPEIEDTNILRKTVDLF